MKEGGAMLRIAICDDEQTCLDKTQAMLEQYGADNGLEFAAETFFGSSALLDCVESGERYDIYLLDIYMPGVSGMSVATELRSKGVRSPIIFLTSSTEHAVEAFGVDATHYLLKPYTQQLMAWMPPIICSSPTRSSFFSLRWIRLCKASSPIPRRVLC